MAEKKNILEEALLDIKSIQNALDANTKEILRSIAKEEIDGVVKESLAREAYEEEGVDVDIEDDDTMASEEITKDDMSIDDMGDDMGDELGDMSMASSDDEDSYENGMDDFESSDELDMTAASDDEVIAIYKKLSGEDEINIVGDEIRLNISAPGEYIVKTSDIDLPASGMPASSLPASDDDDMEYEIELDDEEESSDFVPVDDIEGDDEEMGDEEMGDEEMGDEEMGDEEMGDEEEEEETLDEKIGVGVGMSVGTHRGQGPKSIGAPENPKSKIDESIATKKLLTETANKYNTLLSEAKKLKVENEMFRDGLKEFRTKLVETVIFNSNLTYVTRLFMEHSTTKAEKQNIIKRFDTGVTNLKESKRLYRTIASELEKRETVREVVENKIIKEASTSNSKQLNESTAYVDPSTKRILDLISRVEQK